MNVRWMLPVFSVALVACSGSPAPAEASVTGQWRGFDSTEVFLLDLKQNGTAVTGTYGFGASGQTRVGPITGTFTQGRVSLVVTGEGLLSNRKFTLTGELKGVRLAGDAVYTVGNTSSTDAWFADRITGPPAP